MTSLPIETQAALAITVGLCAWLIGALAWEMAQQPWHRWVGRAAIGAGVLQLAAFANFAAGQVEFWQFVQRGERAHDTGSTGAEFATKSGHTYRIDTSAGRSGTGIGYTPEVFASMGRTGAAGRCCGRCDCGVTGSNGCAGRLHTGDRTEGRSVAPAGPRRRVCDCLGCDCQPCFCGELLAAAARP